MNRVGAIILMTICAGIADVLNFAWKYSKKNVNIPWRYEQYTKYIDNIPWQGIVFALFFGIAVSIVFSRSKEIKSAEIGGGIIVAAISQALLPFFIIILKPVISVISIPKIVLFGFAFAFMLALIVRSVYRVDISNGAIFMVATTGAIVHSTRYIKGLPLSPNMFWFTIVGFVLALFISNTIQADKDL